MPFLGEFCPTKITQNFFLYTRIMVNLNTLISTKNFLHLAQRKNDKQWIISRVITRTIRQNDDVFRHKRK